MTSGVIIAITCIVCFTAYMTIYTVLKYKIIRKAIEEGYDLHG